MFVLLFELCLSTCDYFCFSFAVGKLGFFEDIDQVFAGADCFAGLVEDCDGLAESCHYLDVSTPKCKICFNKV